MASLGHAKNTDVPIEHLDYSYIRECKNEKELEKILRILRSGDEGLYPELIEFTEKRLQNINPKSKLLWKEKPAARTTQLNADERQKIDEDMEQWMAEMAAQEDNLKSASSLKDAFENTSAIRSSDSPVQINSAKTNADATVSGTRNISSTKRAAPRSYKEWDRVNVDAELAKIDKDGNSNEKSVKSHSTIDQRKELKHEVDKEGLHENEILGKANREKEKGNEAFKAGDYDEAIIYYDRSISLHPTATVYNNRALAALRNKDYVKTIEDCTKVIEEEPNNWKAYLRRSIAKKEQKMFAEAKTDIEKVLLFDPDNKKANELLNEIKPLVTEEKQKSKETKKKSKKSAEKTKKGRRMVITEVDDESEVTQTDKKQDEIQNVDKNTVQSGNSIKAEGVHENIVMTNDASKVVTSKDTSLPDVELRTGEENVTAKPLIIDMNDKCESAVCGNSDSSKDDHEVINKNEIGKEDGGDTKNNSNDNSAVPISTELEPEIPQIVLSLKDNANSLYKDGQYGEALTKYSSAIDELNEESKLNRTALAALLNNRAACYFRIGDCTNCIIDCTESLAVIPNAVKTLMRRAGAYETLEKYRDAFFDYKATTVIDKANTAAINGVSRMARILKEIYGLNWREKVNKGSEEFSKDNVALSNLHTNKASKKQPPISNRNSAESEFMQTKNEGNRLVKKGDYKGAIKCYTQCISLRPSEVAPYSNRALCYLKTNQTALAEKDATVVLENDPKNVKALYRRAQARVIEKSYKNAVKDLMDLLKIEPSNIAAKKELDTAKALWLKQMKQTTTKDDVNDSTSNEATQSGRDAGKSKVENNESNKMKKDNVQRKRLQIQELSEDEDDSPDASINPTNVAKDSDRKVDTTQVQHAQATKQTEHKQIDSNQPKSRNQEQYKLKSRNPYEFIKMWETVRKTTNSTSDYVKLLRQISPSSLPKILGKGLEAETLISIVKTLIEQYSNAEDDILNSYEIMKYLTKVERFEISLLLLSDHEKHLIRQALDKIREANNQKIPIEELNSMQGLFKI